MGPQTGECEGLMSAGVPPPIAPVKPSTGRLCIAVRVLLAWAMLLTGAASLVLWPVSYWWAPHASAGYVHFSASQERDSAATAIECGVWLSHGSAHVHAGSIHSTRMGLMGWGISEPGLELDAFVYRTSPDDKIRAEVMHFSGLLNWYAWGAGVRTQSGPQSGVRLSAPLWLVAIVCGATGAVLARSAHRRRFGADCCRHCGYSLIGIVSDRCPECGRPMARRGPSPGTRV